MDSATKISVKNSIAARMLVVVLGLYLVIAVGVTASHVWMEYNNQKSRIITGLGDIESAFNKGLAVSLWGLDQESLTASVKGMLKIPTLTGVKIITDEGGIVALGGIVTEQGESGKTGLHVNLSGLSESEKAVHKGESYTLETFERQFPIVYELEGKSMLLGRAIIYSNSSVIYQRMKLQVAMLGINVALTLITFSLALWWAINRHLRRPLVDLASSAEKVTLENLDSFRVNIETSGQNELKVLEESFNAMIDNLHQSMVEREHAENELRKRESLFRTLVNTIPDLVWLKDGNGVYLSCNKMFERLYGAKEADIVGKTDYDFVDKELADFFRENDQKAMTAGKPSSYEEWVTFTDDGHRALLDSTKTPMLDEDGKMVGVLGVGRDVTERKQTEDKIKEALSFNQQIIDSAKQGIIVYDLSLRYRVWNPFMEQITGVKAADVLGKTPLEVFPFLEGSGVLERLQTILKGKTADSVEFPFHIETTGKSGWTSDSSSALSNATGEVIGVIGIVQNLTEQRETQAQLQQAQKMESIGRLAGGVAHDFNNMLSVILGHAELGLMHLDPTHRVCTDLKEISKTAERSADLTRQLLAFARKQTVSRKVVDLNGIISGMLKMLQRLIGENIHLTCQTAANLWPVKVDPSQIDQILANLCVNARDAIKDNGRITIETENCSIDTSFCKNHLEAVPGEYVRLSVSDNGVGMDKETLLHIFEPFYTTKELGKGTGLGLSTVYGAIKQNNGFINIYSEPWQGTTFSIYIARDAGSRNGQTMEKEGAVAQVARGQETILLVEDDPAILNVASQMLEGQGYTVLKASAPGEALQLVSEHSGMIHLLMTDVVMPELNGSDLAKKILTSYPQIKRLFMSGYTADVIAHHGVLDEGVHFIQKPFSLSNMAAKVREVLDSN